MKKVSFNQLLDKESMDQKESNKKLKTNGKSFFQFFVEQGYKILSVWVLSLKRCKIRTSDIKQFLFENTWLSYVKICFSFS